MSDIIGGDYLQDSEDIRLINKLVAMVHEKYGSISSVKQLAKVSGLSVNKCTLLFHKYFNTSPMEYIKNYRMKMGCQMLTQTNDSVTEISKACGMNISYFCKRVREETGQTPLAYRRAYYRSHDEK